MCCIALSHFPFPPSSWPPSPLLVPNFPKLPFPASLLQGSVEGEEERTENKKGLIMYKESLVFLVDALRSALPLIQMTLPTTRLDMVNQFYSDTVAVVTELRIQWYIHLPCPPFYSVLYYLFKVQGNCEDTDQF